MGNKSMASCTRPRTDVQGVHNFAQISPTLYRGAQPTAEGFAALKAMGVRTVINLRAYHSDRRMVKKAGLKYVHLFCRAWLPRDNQVAEFLTLATDPANGLVYVHCLHGADRTGCMVAAYRMIEQGWTHEAAAAELKLFGNHKIFPQIRRYLKHFNPARFGQFRTVEYNEANVRSV